MNRCIVLSCTIASLLGLVHSTPANPTVGLNDECSRDRDCQVSIKYSRCHLGFCNCQPFFAPYNETTCVESTLLGNECVVPEQCSMKVANSSCLAGVCRCEEGYLQYRKHTCLPPARPGQVCYSHEHCRLWDSDTHCDFLIPDLFGYCQCTAPMKRDGDICRHNSLVIQPSLTTSSPTAGTPPEEDNNEELIDDTTDSGFHLSWLKNATRLLSTTITTSKIPTNMVTRPMYRTPRPHHESTNELPDDNDAVVIEADVITELIQTTTLAPAPTKSDRHETSTVTPVSLGLSCSNDLECRMADANSRCIHGICDCTIAHGNSSIACNGKKTGCPSGTFQCRESGACISWFFVCDGRPDCGDGSDEECTNGSCPSQAFRCGKSGICISRAVQCDGRLDCPHGEDEDGCKNRRRCPEGSFRCNNGQCLPAYEFCNAVVSCRDGSDEPRGACRTRNRSRLSARSCPFRCANGRCRSDAITCSGRDGCGDGSDELNCSVCKCPVVQ
ncbi:vitellogenin receptor [Fopius arisanus]|uniref:VgR_2 protein n=1 Tax=Fopius arisanus TaxID=64838 RepID=A0A0C9RG06_9HYME|nr:PREDICTED: vitellogenin receptor-like [Fopius arisanus]